MFNFTVAVVYNNNFFHIRLAKNLHAGLLSSTHLPLYST
jgi:hypothetical protein